jgi:hypothetical protein
MSTSTGHDGGTRPCSPAAAHRRAPAAPAAAARSGTTTRQTQPRAQPPQDHLKPSSSMPLFDGIEAAFDHGAAVAIRCCWIQQTTVVSRRFRQSQIACVFERFEDQDHRNQLAACSRALRRHGPISRMSHPRELRICRQEPIAMSSVPLDMRLWGLKPLAASARRRAG